VVDLSKYTVSIEQNDALDFVATVKEYPNIRIVEDSYNAAYNCLVDAIGKQPKIICLAGDMAIATKIMAAYVNGTFQEEYK